MKITRAKRGMLVIVLTCLINFIVGVGQITAAKRSLSNVLEYASMFFAWRVAYFKSNKCLPSLVCFLCKKDMLEFDLIVAYLEARGWKQMYDGEDCCEMLALLRESTAAVQSGCHKNMCDFLARAAKIKDFPYSCANCNAIAWEVVG